MLTCDYYLLPGSLPEAFEMIGRFGDQGRIVAGTTDLLPWAREGRGGDIHIEALIDVSQLPELAGIRREGARLHLGANTTFADCLHHPLLLEFSPVMAHCAAWFGDESIRGLATLAGNLINASPAADGTTALLTLNPVITLTQQPNGAPRERKLPLAEFLKGPGATAIEAGEILTGIEIDALAGYGSSFEKVGHRRALVLSTVCLGVMVKLDAGGLIEDVRLALGAVGPVPRRVTECEEFLTGRAATDENIREAAGLPIHYVQSRTRQDYRREVVQGFVERGLRHALAECGAPLSTDN